MPLLIRIIAQRLAVYVLAFLAFLGINPDIDIPTIEEIEQREVEQREIVSDILTPAPENFSEIENKIVDTQKGLVDEFSKIGRERRETKQSVVNDLKEENMTKSESPILSEADVSTQNSFSVQDVVVNIVCVNRNANIIKMSTGSGVVISPSGIILTNAHVANAFLLDEKGTEKHQDCSIRRENIPTYGFNAKLVYISRDWVENNLSFFTSKNPRGTGEDDYALLAITSNTNPSLPLPTSFPYAKLETSDAYLGTGDSIVVAGYPGVNSGVFEIDSNADLKTSSSSVAEVFTFGFDDTVDIVSTTPNTVAQRGASGGGVFVNNRLVGIIVTTDNAGSGSYINAITLSYINRDIKNETGSTLFDFISGNKSSLINSFLNGNYTYLKSLILQSL